MTTAMFSPPIYFLQNTALDLEAIAKRADVKHLMPTHLTSPLKAARQKPLKLPGGKLTKEDDKSAAKSGASEGRLSWAASLRA